MIAVVAVAVVVAYIFGVLVTHRLGHIRREKAAILGEKPPGWHDTFCSGRELRSQRYTPYGTSVPKKGEPDDYGRCDCQAPLFWAIFWPFIPLNAAFLFVLDKAFNFANPSLVEGSRRERKIKALEKELGIDD